MTPEQIAFLADLWKQGLTMREMRDRLNEQFGLEKPFSAINGLVFKYRELFPHRLNFKKVMERRKLQVGQGHPMVKILFEAMNKKKISMDEMGYRTGISWRTISLWRTRTNPSVPDLEACLNVVGLALVVKRSA